MGPENIDKALARIAQKAALERLSHEFPTTRELAAALQREAANVEMLIFLANNE